MRCCFFVGWCLLLAVPASALGQPRRGEPPAEVRRAFEAGNRSYAGSDYAQAVEHYERALASPWASSALHYNVAGARYRLGDFGAAVRHYEKARALGFSDEERLRHNLGVVHGQLDAPPPVPRALRSRIRSQVNAWVAPGLVLVLGMALFLGALAWWVRDRSDPARPVRPPAGAAALLVVGLGLAVAGLLLSAMPPEGRAVALSGPLTMRDTPAGDSTAALPEGTVVRLTERDGPWMRVRSSRGEAGWVRAQTLGEI